MRILILLISLSLFISCSSNSKEQHTDIAELGLKGKVKTMTTVFYNNVQQENGKWKPSSEEAWSVKAIAYYNANGMIERVDRITAPHGMLIYPDTNYIMFTYDKGGKTATVHDVRGNVKNKLKHEWLDKRRYRVEEYDILDKLTFSNETWLDSKYRAIANEAKFYDVKGEPHFTERVDITLNDDGLPIMQTKKDLKTNESRTEHLSYTQFDPTGNPIEITLSKEKGERPFQFIRKRYEYY